MIERLNPPRFEDPSRELAFFQDYCLGNIKVVQGATFLAGLILYVFFIWDKTIDPQNWQKTQAIRGLVLTPGIWVAAALYSVPRLHAYMEAIVTAVSIFAFAVLVWICLSLDNAFDYAEAGLIIVYFFLSALIPLRLPYYIVIFGVSLPVMIGGQLYSHDYKSGMLLINTLYTTSAIVLALVSVTTREMDAGRQLIKSEEIAIAKSRFENLLNTLLPPQEIKRLVERQARDTPTKLAISYRRADADAMAGRIRGRLSTYFGADSVFMDIDSIPFGLDFRSHVREVLGQIDVLLVIIGPDWLVRRSREDGAGYRIHEPTDPVRVEIETAMAAGVVIVPVLVGEASMPLSTDLPETLHSFAFRNAAEVDAGRDFASHMDRLLRAIDDILERKQHSPEPGTAGADGSRASVR